MKVTRALGSLLVLVAGCGGGSPAPEPVPTPVAVRPARAAPDAPTVILISIDTLRADHLGCYGYPRPTSPHLDRFSRDAVRFDWAIAHAPSTLPSHASMLTSLLPEHHGAFFSRRASLPPNIPTLATVLADAGYRTAAFTGGGQIAPEFGLGRGFEVYAVDSGGSAFSDAVDAGLEWLRRDPAAPAFLFLHTYQPHHPYTPDPATLALFDDGYSGDLPDAISVELLEAINRGERSIDGRDLAHIVAAYDAEIRAVDEAFGTLLEGLVDLGIDERSVIALTSDHGEEFGEHGAVGWHSHTLYDELLRVPLLIRFPDRRHAGLAVADQVRLIDLAPTLLAAAGLRVPDSFAGVTLQTLAAGSPVALPALSQLDLPAGERAVSLRAGGLKLYPRRAMMASPFEFGPPPLLRRVANRVSLWRRPDALFDLASDPGERLDVAPSRPLEVDELRREAAALMAARPGPAAPPTATVDDATRRALEALGYVR